MRNKKTRAYIRIHANPYSDDVYVLIPPMLYGKATTAKGIYKALMRGVPKKKVKK